MAEFAGGWTWVGDDLHDARGEVIASVRADVLEFGGQRLLIERSRGRMRFRMRATADDGAVYLLLQHGMTVRRLQADCDGRAYQVYRMHALRRQRVIVGKAGPAAIVAPTRGQGVTITDLPGLEGVPWIDAVFLSYGCTMLDGPPRRERLRRA